MGNEGSKLDAAPGTWQPNNNDDPLAAFNGGGAANGGAGTSGEAGGANLNDMPNVDELNERFNLALTSMNLTKDQLDKVKTTYNNEAKWKLIQEQERQQIKNNPAYYLAQLKSYSAFEKLLESCETRDFTRF